MGSGKESSEMTGTTDVMIDPDTRHPSLTGDFKTKTSADLFVLADWYDEQGKTGLAAGARATGNMRHSHER